MIITPDNEPFVDLVQIRSDSSFGTGLLVGRGLVLTALHCVRDPDNGWQVFDNLGVYLLRELQLGEERHYDAHIVWPRTDSFAEDPPDVAILKLDLTDPPEALVNHCFGELPRVPTTGYALGFPRTTSGKQLPGGRIEHNQPGRVTYTSETLRALTIDATGRHELEGRERWAGLSGGPLLINEFIVGVMRNVPDGWKGEAINAEPLAPLLRHRDDDSLRTLLDVKLPLESTDFTRLLRASDRPSPSVFAFPRPGLCLGRGADTEVVVSALLSEHWPVAVLARGPGGIGKTTLTQQAGNDPRIATRFGKRRWFVALDTAQDRDGFDALMLQALGLEPTYGFEAALALLVGGRTLFVLDNLDAPWVAAPLAIEERLAQLAGVPELALLASFRGEAAVGGAPWSLRHPVQPLAEMDARTLFLTIAETISGNDPYLPAVLEVLGGVPLALCLTARRVTGRNELAELWDEWQAVGPVLARLPTTAAHRLTSVTHSIELSLRAPGLTEAGRRLFRLLGQLPAGIAAEDRRALLGGVAFDAEGELRGIGLAVGVGRRLDLLPPVREHARRAHQPTGEDATWFHYYLSLIARLGSRLGGEGGAEAASRIVPELPNIEAAIHAAIAVDTLVPAVGAVYGLGNTMRFSGFGSTGALNALAAACVGDDFARAKCLLRVADIGFYRSDHKVARARFEEVLPLFQRVGDVIGEAYCIHRLGDIALARSDLGVAEVRFEEALQLFRRVGDPLSEAVFIQRLGYITLARFDNEPPQARFEEDRPVVRAAGAMLGEATAIQRLGDIAFERRDYVTARARFTEALPLFQRAGHVNGKANCIQRLGDIALASSDASTAQARFEEALRLFRRIGAVLGEANCLRRLGDVALARSDYSVARVHYLEALPLFQRVRNVLGEAKCFAGLGELARSEEGTSSRTPPP